jgi:hypothetical protein
LSQRHFCISAAVSPSPTGRDEPRAGSLEQARFLFEPMESIESYPQRRCESAGWSVLTVDESSIDLGATFGLGFAVHFH